jgi:hypothetical protein
MTMYIGMTDLPPKEEVMPKLMFARPPQSQEEEHRIHKRARSRHAPAHWLMRARIIMASWQGHRTTAIAAALNCHPQTVRKHITRFNVQGLAGLGTGPGRAASPG